AVGVFAWPVLGAVVNLPRQTDDPAGSGSLKMISLNTDGGRFSRAALDALLTIEAPDVVAIQESADDMGEAEFWGPAWHVVRGPASVLIASRFELHPAGAINLEQVGGRGGAVRGWVDCSLGKVTVAAIHLDTPRWGLEAMQERDIDGVREN